MSVWVPVLVAVVFFALGAAVGALRVRRRSMEEAVRNARELAMLEARAEAADRLAHEQRAFVETSRHELENAFRSLATLALRGNSDEFLKLAEARWSTTREQAARDLEERKQGIETLLAPLRETLGRLERHTIDVEKSREGAFKGLEREIEQLRRTASSLDERTMTLSSALKGTKAQGRWGELALRNVVELSGMSEHVDFTEQETLADGGRPDMIVRLPGGRFLAVDAKVSLNAYLESADATNDEQREKSLDLHVTALRTHVRALAARDYAASIPGDLDLVVMFLPADPFLSAAFQRCPELQTEALRARVLIATPTTLLALLRTVGIYWQQQALAENAERIAETARTLYDRASNFGGHLSRVGEGLEKAVDAYNQAVGSFERKFLPMGMRLEELKATAATGKVLTAPSPVEDAPRRVDVSTDDDLAVLPLFDTRPSSRTSEPRRPANEEIPVDERGRMRDLE